MVINSLVLRNDIWYRLEILTDSKFSYSSINMLYCKLDSPIIINTLSTLKRSKYIFLIKREKKVLFFTYD